MVAIPLEQTAILLALHGQTRPSATVKQRWLWSYRLGNEVRNTIKWCLSLWWWKGGPGVGRCWSTKEREGQLKAELLAETFLKVLPVMRWGFFQWHHSSWAIHLPAHVNSRTLLQGNQRNSLVHQAAIRRNPFFGPSLGPCLRWTNMNKTPPLPEFESCSSYLQLCHLRELLNPLETL